MKLPKDIKLCLLSQLLKFAVISFSIFGEGRHIAAYIEKEDVAKITVFFTLDCRPNKA